MYTARLTVSDGEDQAPAQPIVIQLGIPPTLTVAEPADGALYRAGDTITYNAFAWDAAGFDVDDGDIKTEVRLRHGTHYHPFVGPLTGRVWSFTIPATGEASADTAYEIKVTATDGSGLSSTGVVMVRPRTSHVTLATSPPGLGLTLDGVPVVTPRTVEGVIGFQRGLAAPTTAVAADGTQLQFAGWSDGRSIRHTIATPEADTTYTATYVPSQPFAASYFANLTLSGTPVLTRQDPKIDFVWDDVSPDPAVPANGFSARWSKTQWFGAGRYRFTTVTDDGVRLYIDNKRVIDHWQGQAPTAYAYEADLGTGNHTIRMEYFEGGGGALATLTWESTTEQPDESFRAEYWNVPATGQWAIPGGAPTLSRGEPAIDHDWGYGSPADGVLVLNQWVLQEPTTRTVTRLLDQGTHELVLEYFDNGGGAIARFAFEQTEEPPPPPPPVTPFAAEFFANPTLDGTPAVTRTDDAVDFDWGSGTPDPAVPDNGFSARWTRTMTYEAGTYRLTATVDDGIRVLVDGVTVVDGWRDHGPTTFTADVALEAGQHTVVVEYYERNGGALARFTEARL